MSNRLIIINASELVTCSGFEAKKGVQMNNLSIICNGGLIIEDDKIVDIGETEDILSSTKDSNYHVIDATGKTVMPGFVDSHTHFVFGGYRAEEYSWRLRGENYMEIMKRGGGIFSSVEATKNSSKDELIRLGAKRLDSMLRFGVTTVEGKSGYGLDFETEVKQLEVMKELNSTHAIDIVSTFLGAHAVPKNYKGREDDYIDYIIDNVLPVIRQEQLAEFCDIFCEKNVFTVVQSRKLLNSAKKHGLKVKIHADEIARLGGAELAAELSAVSADHLLMVSNNGIEDMKLANVIATLLPGTAFSLREDFARARYMIDNGLAVALASDFNPGSCFTESIPLLIALATLKMNMTTEETITALTINAAAAIDRAKSIGSLDIGKKADIVIHEFPSYHFLPYHIGVSTVETVIKNGKIVI